MAYYDIGEVFQRIEEEMIASMTRNLKRHLRTEKEEGLNYAMWQAEQLAALNEFKRNNKSLFGRYFSTINGQIEEVLRKAHETGKMEQEIQILEAIRKGWSTSLKSSSTIQGAFFRINDRKLKALINSVTKDMKKAETAMLRRANDEYRKIIFNSQAYYNTGAGTLPQCVDMATKDFLASGINCIEYANGARVGIDAYSRMAIRTAATRAYLLGESVKRDEWGVSTVIVNKRGVACPKCLKYVGKVFYDDVWGSAPIPSPEKYPRLSEAIAGGLYHPNCKDIHTTYFEGISTPPEPMTEEQKKEAARVYNLEQQQRYNERQIRKYKRLSDGSVDPENRDRYYKKLSAWQDTQKKFVKANGDVLKRRYENESIHGIGPIDNADTRKTVESMKREAAKIKDMRTVLGEEKIPVGVDIWEEMPYNDTQMRYVNLDYTRRKRLIEHPELKLPHVENATIADEKFTKYLFNPDNARGWAKGQAMTSRLGYSIDNWEELQSEIKKNASDFPATAKRTDEYGTRYEQLQIIYGLKGKPANVVVGWNVLDNNVHLSSMYIEEVKK
jgi:hypothetical protein